MGLYLGARAEDLTLSSLERRLAAIASLHKEEGYESPASVAEGPLRKIWKGLVREKTRQQDGAPPLMVEDLKSIIEHLPRYSSSDDGPKGDSPTGRLTLTSLRDRALLLIGWIGALRRSELVALTTEDIQFIEGEGVNIYVRRSKSDQEAEGHARGLPYGSNKETRPVTALRQWLQAAARNVEGNFEGDIFRRFYHGESIGESAMTAQYVSTVLKRHAEGAGLDPEACSAHSLRAGFITQAIRAGKAERRAGEHSGHQSWETFNLCARGGRDLSGQSRRGHWALRHFLSEAAFPVESGKRGTHPLSNGVRHKVIKLTYGPKVMKSKLTLRLDDDLKERAKRLADKRGISVSQLVEDYFRLLLREPAGTGGRSSKDSGLPETSGDHPKSEEALSPRVRELTERLGKPAPAVEMDEDTERWIDAAAEKHR